MTEYFDVIWARDTPPPDLPAESRRVIQAVATTSAVQAGPALLELLPGLRHVATFSVGYDHIDVAAMISRGVTVTNTPGVLDACVADFAIGQVIALLRRIGEGERHLRAGQWMHGPMPLGAGLGGKTIGLYGLGAIGRQIARRAEAFNMHVAYHGRRRRDDVGSYEFYDSLVALAAACDVLVVILHASPATVGSVNADVLTALGPEGFLVNVARASIVDQSALIEALRERRIAGAALDVFPDEPHVDPALLDVENVLLTPHQGGASDRARGDMGRLMVANLLAHSAGRALPTPPLTGRIA